jgi:hypothetical protein
MTTFVGETTINANGLSSRGFRTKGAGNRYMDRLMESRRAESCSGGFNGLRIFVVSWREVPAKKETART